MTQELLELQTFREQLYYLFPKRKDAIVNLLDAITNYGHQCCSVIQLSNTECFKRKYSSITDAIADGLPDADWKEIRKLIYQIATTNQDKKPNRFILDCTSNPRPFAKNLADRMIVHAPNPAPGNKPICVGHQYSMLALLPNDEIINKKHWLVPLSVERVRSDQKGNEVGMLQVTDYIKELGLSDKVNISIGDSLYGSENCRATASLEKNLIHIFRLNSARNVFLSPEQKQKKTTGKGRKKEFGNKMNLKDSCTHVPCDEQTEISWANRKGKEYKVIIKCWRDMLLRGSRKFRSSQHPLSLIQINVVNKEGEAMYKKPLWLAVLGEKRTEISLREVYDNYKSRYDIEHFFRFGKRKLLMDAYQTMDVEHEELWWRLCSLAYVQLYLAKFAVSIMPQPWEKYLPQYKDNKFKKGEIATPTQTQRGFRKLLDQIGTPAAECVARGKAAGRKHGDLQVKRPEQEIVFKTKKIPQQARKSILSVSNETSDNSKPQRIEQLLGEVKARLNKINMPLSEFAQMLLNTG